MKKIISIIVPVYNAEKWIKKCIDSIIKQTYKDIEIILVDDGSTDKSSTICDNYSFFNIPKDKVSDCLSLSNEIRYKGKRVLIEVAKEEKNNNNINENENSRENINSKSNFISKRKFFLSNKKLNEEKASKEEKAEKIQSFSVGCFSFSKITCY